MSSGSSRSKALKNMTGKKPISIIVVAHNEEKYIDKTLQSINNQDYNNKEIIVVCDSCSDNTECIAKKYTRKVYVVDFKRASKARNFGVTKSKGKILVFFDADTIAEPQYLSTIAASVKKGFDVGCAKMKSESNSLRGTYVTWVLNRWHRKQRTVGGNCFVTRSSFDTVQGFDENMFRGEDNNLGHRLRARGYSFVFMENTRITPSQRKYRKHGYFTYYLYGVYQAVVYMASRRLHRLIFN